MAVPDNDFQNLLVFGSARKWGLRVLTGSGAMGTGVSDRARR